MGKTYKIIHGADEIIRKFTEDLIPESILAYVNMSKFNGDMFFRLGFNTSIKNIGYPFPIWYNPLRNEIGTYQSLGMEVSKESDMFLEAEGFLKIYDSGNIRFEWLAEGTSK